jgi:hypothetical protein
MSNSTALKKKPLRSSETSGKTDPVTKRRIPEDPNPEQHCCGNLESGTDAFLLHYRAEIRVHI